MSDNEQTENSQIIQTLIQLRNTLDKRHGHFLYALESEKEKYEPKFQEIISTIDVLFKHIDCVLKSECRHIYVEDWIDITPDKSQKITYCKLCESTFTQF